MRQAYQRKQTLLSRHTEKLALERDLELRVDTPSLQRKIIAAVKPCNYSLTHTTILRFVCTCIRALA